MHQHKFDEVRDLIDQQRYDEARALLVTIDHPLTEKWLNRIDEADPTALTPTQRQVERQAARETHLQLWMKQERRIARWTGMALFAFAFYLWQFETVLWVFSPGLFVQMMPLLVAAAGAYLMWNVHDSKRLRRQILRMQSGELRKVSWVLIPSAGLLTLLTMVMGNRAQFAVAAFLVVIGGLNLWRAAQAEHLNHR
jgi:hypothetical protein